MGEGGRPIGLSLWRDVCKKRSEGYARLTEDKEMVIKERRGKSEKIKGVKYS